MNKDWPPLALSIFFFSIMRLDYIFPLNWNALELSDGQIKSAAGKNIFIFLQGKKKPILNIMFYPCLKRMIISLRPKICISIVFIFKLSPLRNS